MGGAPLGYRIYRAATAALSPAIPIALSQRAFQGKED